MTRPAATPAATTDQRTVIVDTLPPDTKPASEEPPYRLPSPLHHNGPGLPVASSAPRVPRALRAFNGTPEPPSPPPPPPLAAPRNRASQPQRTIRDLLLDAPVETEEAGLLAGLRSAWRRLRRPEDLDGGDED